MKKGYMGPHVNIMTYYIINSGRYLSFVENFCDTKSNRQTLR